MKVWLMGYEPLKELSLEHSIELTMCNTVASTILIKPFVGICQ